MNTHPALYLNNYRGFHNTYLELKSVSFLIGENSSGKTSLLKLIKLLSSHQFWFSYDFNCEKLDLGYFSEIASKHKSEDYFEIGLTHKQPQFAESNSNTMNFIKMRFVEQNGIPKLESVRMKFESFDAKLVYGKKVQKIYYNSITAEKKQKSITNADFKKWAFSNLENESFENSFEINEMGQFPMSFISDFIAEDFSKKSNSNESRKPPYIRGFSIPSFLPNVTWIAPIRVEPKRTYDSYRIDFSPEGDHIPYLIRTLFANKSKKNADLIKILNKFGNESGLFQKISIKLLGKETTSPFEVEIYFNDEPYKISNVGYGVSQVLPLIVELLSRPKQTWFALQQPEIHLHPRGQAAFGEFLFKTRIMENKNFIVETHSDYMIDRFRLRTRRSFDEGKILSDQFQVVYFEKKKLGNELHIIEINPDGTYSENQPKGFRDFFIKEQLNLLEL